MNLPHAELQQLFAFFSARRFADMAQRAQTLLTQHPTSGELWKALSVAQQMQGQDALLALQRAVALLPNDADLPGNLASLLADRGQHAEAAAAYQQALRLRPASAALHNNLGKALAALGQHEQALASYRQALRLQPDFIVAQRNLARTLNTLARPVEAIAAFHQLLNIEPGQADTWLRIGLIELDSGELQAAVASLRQALALQADHLPAVLNLGTALLALGDYPAAAAQFEQALRLTSEHAPEHAAAHADLSLALQGMGQFDAALMQLRRAVALAPANALIQGNLGKLLKDLGRSDEAVVHYRRAVALRPDDLIARSALLFALNYTAEPSLDEARGFGSLVATNVATNVATGAALTFSKLPAQRLRVGLIAADLRAHPVGFFAESVLAELSQRVDLFVYANTPTQDSVTARIRAHCTGWAVVHDEADDALLARIRADGLDVLLDLNGHTAGNRLPVFARRAAPVQASWLGYCATTGVEAMDGFIGDPWITPPASQAHFSEQLLCLPETFLCFTPPTLDLPVGPLPALKNGHITFGCFNSPAKLNDTVLALWARVLNAVPGSRLLLKAMPYASPDMQRDLRQRFEHFGLSADRLAFEAGSTRDAYLAAYQQIDIALDPFPYPGGTTSIEGLWMGVPVLTLAGDKALSLQGVSILQNIGLPDWIAADANDYLARAVRHASDLPALAALRGQLRPRLLASPLCDAPRFAGHFEAALQALRAGRQSPSFTAPA